MEAESVTESGPTAADGDRADLLESLDEATCLRLLEASEVGRLAVIDDDRPRLVVLNYLLEGRTLLFRTREDALIARLTGEGLALHAEFEVDSALASARAGWSVIVSGVLVRERDPHRTARARGSIEAWAQGDRDVVLRLDAGQFTGRRAGAL